MSKYQPWNDRNYRAYREWLRTQELIGEPVQCVGPDKYGLVFGTPGGGGCLRVATQPNHINAVADGGGYTENNLEPTCSRCNQRLSARRTNQLKKNKQLPRDY